MLLYNKKTRKSFKARIEPITKSDFVIIKKDERFQFDWKKEEAYMVFKIMPADSDSDSDLILALSETK